MLSKTIPNYIILFISIYTLISCNDVTHITHTPSFEIKYLDEYVIYNDSIFNDSKIGGLSGIEYDKERNIYYLVCDDAKKPRFYKTSITIADNKFDTVSVHEPITIKDSIPKFPDSTILDLEAIRIFKKNQFIFSSEGSIKHHRNPSIFITDTLGNYLDQFVLPSYFMTNTSNKNIPRHNGVFEGLAHDINTAGYWASMELPLELDGEEPTVKDEGAPVRITHFSTHTNQADFQFTYPLDKLTKDPKGKFGVNGVTDLLQLSTNQFLIIERGYAAGYGTQGNTIRIYLTNTKKTTNTLGLASLKGEHYSPSTKQLLFDFESIRDQLTDKIVDNIEGITFGPILANGNQSLILISDNNFNPVSEQINQLILLELIKVQ